MSFTNTIQIYLLTCLGGTVSPIFYHCYFGFRNISSSSSYLAHQENFSSKTVLCDTTWIAILQKDCNTIYLCAKLHRWSANYNFESNNKFNNGSYFRFGCKAIQLHTTVQA